MFYDFTKKLELELRKDLPGLFAQQKMSPSLRFAGKGFPENKMLAQNSGVLILLYPGKSGVDTVLMQRTKYNGAHSGQISLPGGKAEKPDKNLIETALREAYEEIGINLDHVVVIGQLTPLYVPVSNFQILPVVGYTSIKPEFSPDPKEVNQLIEVALGDLFDPEKSKIKEVKKEHHQMVCPYFEVGPFHVWGATAMILSELREILSNAGLID